MVGKEINKQSLLKQQLYCLILSNITFYLLYNLASWHTSQQEVVNSFVFNFEKNIPFLSWLIIPYMTSGVFFTLVFFFCRTKEELFSLTKRINFITIVSCLVFLAFPLQHTFVKPEVHQPFLGFLFDLLGDLDNNFNQAPSLHVSYAIIFATVVSTFKLNTIRITLYIWLGLMIISTICIYQHHLIDIISSLLLVSITFYIFPLNPKPNTKIAMLYWICSTTILFLASLIFRYTGNLIICAIILWIAIVLSCIGLAYLQSHNTFLKNRKGKIPILKQVFYFPYIFTYRCIRTFFCKNNKNTVTEVLPKLFIGPKLNRKELLEIGFNESTIIIDLMAEIEESASIQRKMTYHCFPLLDIAGTDQAYLKHILSEVKKIYKTNNLENRIYMHCLMGYSRSTTIACIFINQQLNISIKEAVTYITEKHKHSIVNKHLLSLLENNFK